MSELKTDQLGNNYELWYKKVPENCDSIEELLPTLIDLANLAPSSHNSQPWKFESNESNNSLTIAPDLNRRLEASDPTDRQLYISVGAAVANVKVAARYYGWQVEEEILFNVDGTKSKQLLFKPGYQPNDEDKTLFRAIQQRVSSRRQHTGSPLSTNLIDFISKQGTVMGTEVYLVRKGDKGSAVTAQVPELVGSMMHEATGQVLQNSAFKAELSKFVHPNYTTSYDGMPAFGFGATTPVGDLDSIDFPKIVLSGMLAQEAPRQELDLLVNHTSGISFICTHDDNPEFWLQAGETLELIALKATSEGFSVSPLAGLIEVPKIRQELRKVLKTNFYPQAMLRIGKPVSETHHSPRRPSKYTKEVGEPGKKVVVNLDKPTIFEFQKGKFTLEDLYGEFGPFKVNDKYVRYLADLYSLDNPTFDPSKQSERDTRNQYVETRNNQFDGVWVYFPWDEELVHILGRSEFKRLFYSRNNPCILPAEQKAIGDLKIAIGGLSVGSNIAIALARMGVENLTVSDMDTIDLSNESRMAVGDVASVGERKTDVLAKVIYSFNPFINLRVVPEGFGPHNLAEVLSSADVYIDHMDNLPLKIEARKMARIMRKIIIMATDIDKRPLLDIELPDNPKLFNGRADDEVIRELMLPPKSFAEWCRKAVQIFGFENTSAPVLENFVSNAKKESNYGSQLGLTGNIVAGFIAYYIYEIARGNASRLTPFRIIPIEQDDLVDNARLDSARKKYEEVIGY
jgi:hypothetical protein